VPEVILNCPQCQHPLRVPEEMQGQPVRCPACGMTFTVPAGSSTAESEIPMAEAAYPAPEGPSYFPPARERARAALNGPAIGLLVSGALSLLTSLYFLLGSLNAAPEDLANQMRQKKMDVPPAETLARMLKVVSVGSVSSAGIGLVVLLAAIQMLRTRAYGLCLTGSILSLINCGCLCGFPFGIWALVVLLRADVRDAFP
jgi:hypothetical protein